MQKTKKQQLIRFAAPLKVALGGVLLSTVTSCSLLPQQRSETLVTVLEGYSCYERWKGYYQCPTSRWKGENGGYASSKTEAINRRFKSEDDLVHSKCLELGYIPKNHFTKMISEKYYQDVTPLSSSKVNVVIGLVVGDGLPFNAGGSRGVCSVKDYSVSALSNVPAAPKKDFEINTKTINPNWNPNKQNRFLGDQQR